MLRNRQPASFFYNSSGCRLWTSLQLVLHFSILLLSAPPGMMMWAYFMYGFTKLLKSSLTNLLYLEITSLASLPLSLMSLSTLRARAMSASQWMKIFISSSSLILWLYSKILHRRKPGYLLISRISLAESYGARFASSDVFWSSRLAYQWLSSQSSFSDNDKLSRNLRTPDGQNHNCQPQHLHQFFYYDLLPSIEVVKLQYSYVIFDFLLDSVT